MMGWIKIERSIRDHWLWSDEKKLKWWLTVLLEVNYSDRQMSLGYRTHDVKRGQSSNSIRTWAAIFKTGTKSVVRFFDMLEMDGLITKDVVGNGKHSTTLITVCKYDSYDHDGSSKETQVDTQETTQVTTQVDTQEGDKRRKKESKERKKERNIGSYPTVDEVIEYVVSNGYDQSIAEKFHAYYSASNWKDRNGDQVKSWKGKLNSVWLKRENKRDVRQPALENGMRYVDISEAYGIVRELYSVSLSEKESQGSGDEFVRKMMNMNKFYEAEGDGWKYRSSK